MTTSGTPAGFGAEPTTSTLSPEKRIQLLKALVDLKASGALTDEEFAVEKKKILGN